MYLKIYLLSKTLNTVVNLEGVLLFNNVNRPLGPFNNAPTTGL
ncbi:hypothetical protein SAMN04488024_102670 [Pedobacter soli]|uniref:Uncharacterized protein n=1 Tax=Pedobacter soli TaxID=390242 RepID=A0A1G6NGH9_9SPHI|nr:hypothetical protein SAMN04488024_102670 [Pedobacter soli]